MSSRNPWAACEIKGPAHQPPCTHAASLPHEADFFIENADPANCFYVCEFHLGEMTDGSEIRVINLHTNQIHRGK